MSTLQVASEWPVDDLLAAVKRLPLDRRRDFARRFLEWNQQESAQAAEEAALIQATRTRLPEADAQRLRQLNTESERRPLNPVELDEYQRLARWSQQVDVTRLRALADLVKRRGRAAPEVMREIGWTSGSDGS